MQSVTCQVDYQQIDVATSMTYIDKLFSISAKSCLPTELPDTGLLMRPAAPRPKHVAVCIDWRDGTGRRRLQGVAQYAYRKSWRMMRLRSRGREAARAVARMRPDGILAYITEAPLAEAAARLAIPLVETGIAEVEVPLSISLEDREVARLALETFLRLGLENIGYCGVDGRRASAQRQDHFRSCLQQRGLTLRTFSQSVGEGESRITPLVRWLQSLPDPVGILAFDDKIGERVLAACHRAGLSVPDRVTVIGVGNDDLISKLTWPSLSSINVPAERIGFEGAEILDRTMQGARIRLPHRKIAPTDITLRASTAAAEIRDIVVERAVRYIAECVSESIGVDHIARHVNVSRRTLDRRFAKVLGRSVHEELVAVRLQKACGLLTDSRQPVATIAEACGFWTVASFSRAFRQHMDCSPTEYRSRANSTGRT